MKNAQHETGTAAHAHRVVILGAGTPAWPPPFSSRRGRSGATTWT